MRRPSAKIFSCLLLSFLCLVVNLPVSAQQPIPVNPTHLYRFRRSNQYLGYLLTTDYAEGANNGLVYEGVFGQSRGMPSGVWRQPADGWTPDPSSGLVALHRYLVVHGPRVYYHYTTYPGGVGSNYYYEGIIGYVFPAGQTTYTSPATGNTMNLRKLSTWYSQNYGYWPGIGAPGDTDPIYEFPPDNSFAFHGVVAALPAARFGTKPCTIQDLPCSPDSLFPVNFNPPPEPPPPPDCDPWSEQNCYSWGGWWDPSTCNCYYY